MTQKLTAADIAGVVGIVPTPATPDAGHWDAVNTVNLPETEKMIQGILDAGIGILMTTGTFGECATLTAAELRDFVDCVVQTTAGRAPVFAGITTLNTRDTIVRARELVRLGADGIFCGRPMWLPLDDRGIVRYYRDLAAALPGIPIVIYDNPEAFKGKISSEAYAELAKIPEVIASKHGGNAYLEADLKAVGKAISLFPIDISWLPAAKKFPDQVRACWSGAVACAPAPIAAFSRAIVAGDWPAAEALHERIHWASAVMFPAGNIAQFVDYSIPLGRARFRAAEFIDPGPSRPPYTEAPQELLELSLEAGRRWKQLQAEFAESKVAAHIAR